MSSKYALAAIDIYLVDKDLNTRQSCKHILYNSGFRDVRMGTTLQNVVDTLNSSNPDILICAAELDDGDFIETISQIRTRKVGNNPFIPMITLVDNPSPELILRVVQSGTDAVIAKPISTTGLVSRVMETIEARKQFVMSEGYLGPIRKTDRMRGTTVPNTIKYKAEGKKFSYKDLENAITSTIAKLKITSVDVIGVEIASHVTNLLPMLEKAGRVTPEIRVELLGLLEVTDLANEKLAGSQFEYAVELCELIGTVASQIVSSRNGQHDPKHVKLLKPLSQAIQACFSGAITSDEQVRSIVAHIGVD